MGGWHLAVVTFSLFRSLSTPVAALGSSQCSVRWVERSRWASGNPYTGRDGSSRQMELVVHSCLRAPRQRLGEPQQSCWFGGSGLGKDRSAK